MRRVTETVGNRQYPYMLGTLANTGQASLHKPRAVIYVVPPDGRSASASGGSLKADSLGAGDFDDFKISLSAERDGRKVFGPELEYTIKP